MPKIDISNYTDQKGSFKKELKDDGIVIERNKKYEKVTSKTKPIK